MIRQANREMVLSCEIELPPRWSSSWFTWKKWPLKRSVCVFVCTDHVN